MTNIQPTRPETRDAHAGGDMLTINEVAKLVRAPVATLRYWRHLGCGPRSFKVGRHVRYWRADVILWLTEQTNRPQNH